MVRCITVAKTLTIENPDSLGMKNVDSQGRVYLGDEYKGKRIEFVVSEIINEEEELESS